MLQANTKWIKIGLVLYIVTSLISMAVMSIGSAILAVCFLFAFHGPRNFFNELRETFKKHRTFAWISGLFALICVASLVSAKVWPPYYGGLPVDIYLMKDSLKVWYFVWPFVLLTGYEKLDEKDRASVLRAWLITFLVLSFIGIFQFFTGWPRVQAIPQMTQFNHATLFLGHHLSVASIMIFPFFVALDLLFHSQNKRVSTLSKPILALIVLIGFIALMLSFSRMLWISLPIGIYIYFLLRLPLKKSLALLMVGVFIFAASMQSPQIRKRMSYDGGIQDRYILWKANWKFFKDHPVLGVGWRKNHDHARNYVLREVYPFHNWRWIFIGHAHNNAIEMLSGLGILGFLAWLSWNGQLFIEMIRRKVSWDSAESLAFPIGLIAAWIVFHLNGLTQVNFWESKVMHQMMWSVVLILSWHKARPKSSAHVRQE